jgi:SulP family sulfate permease
MSLTEDQNIPPAKRILGFDVQYLISEWKEIINPKTVMADAWAGVTVALVALPLNLALAIASGVEPGIGITTGIVAGIIASLLGGQKFGVTGPAAALAVVLIGIAESYGLGAIWLVGILAGVLQIAAGYFRLGKLISFIPMPVIVGFANAIGILVVLNSLRDFLGLPRIVAHTSLPVSPPAHPYIPEILEDINSLVSRAIMHGEINPLAVGTGMIVLFLAIIVPKWTKVVPSQLVAIVAGSLIAALAGFHLPKIIDISSVPAYLPVPHWPDLPWTQFGVLFPVAITVFMLGSIESLLSASVADGMTMTKRHHSNQELIGQGMANVITPFFGGIPVTGVIVRTAVNIRAGAKTRLSGIVHSLTLLILVLAFAKYAEQIPLSALAGILILTGFRLIEWDATRQIWHASRTEGWVVFATTAISVLIDLTAGVFTGLLLACALFIKQISTQIVVPEEAEDRRANVRQPIPSCKFVRTFLIDGPLFFGAAERFTETILLTQNLKVIVLHMKAVSGMDLTGAETILSIHSQLRRNGIRLCLTELPHQPFELLKRTGALEKIGVENIFKDYGKCLLDVNATLLETSCSDCRDLLAAPPKTKIGAPKDCPLRAGIVLNTNQISSLLKKILSEEKNIDAGTESSDIDTSKLIAVKSESQIPECLRETPIYSLLKSQNLLQVDETPSDKADLIIGMCIDFRKQLHLPKNCAYVIRRAGANMKDCEFELALALSAGIEYMALITHNKCLMSNPYTEERSVLETLSTRCGWKEDRARSFFYEQSTARGISDPVQFVLSESDRISALFKGLKVIPLLYSVDDDKLYLVNEWLKMHHTSN